jgi:hypothetical protein
MERRSDIETEGKLFADINTSEYFMVFYGDNYAIKNETIYRDCRNLY